MFSIHRSAAGDGDAFVASITDDKLNIEAEKLGAKSSDLGQDVLETRLAVDLFSRSLAQQQRIFEREIEEVMQQLCSCVFSFARLLDGCCSLRSLVPADDWFWGAVMRCAEINLELT